MFVLMFLNISHAFSGPWLQLDRSVTAAGCYVTVVAVVIAGAITVPAF